MADTTSTTIPPTPEQIRARWDRVAPGFDDHLTPLHMALTHDVLRRHGVTSGTTFLDVAAGSGALSIPAARLGASVVATDISPMMLDRLAARARQEDLTRVETRVMDGHALDLPDDTFDLSASLHGVSVFADMSRGLREMVRVTRPGGQVLVIAFGPPSGAEFLTFVLGALRATVPGFVGLPTDPPPLPFQVADPDRFRGRLTDAGLADVRVHPSTWDLPVGSAAQLWDMFCNSNPIAATLLADLSDEQVADAQQVLAGMLRERSEGHPQAVLHVAVNIGRGTA